MLNKNTKITLDFTYNVKQKHQDYTRLYFILLNKTPRLHYTLLYNVKQKYQDYTRLYL